MFGPSLAFDSTSPRSRERGEFVETPVVLVVPPGSCCHRLHFSFEAFIEGVRMPGERGSPPHNTVRDEVGVDHEGPWGPGEHEISAILRTPRFPLSFEGSRIGVRWMLNAFAQFEGADVPSSVASMPIVVIPGPSEERVVVPTANGDPARVHTPERRGGANHFALPVLFGVFAMVLLRITTATVLRGEDPWGWLVGALPAMGLSFGTLPWARKRVREDAAEAATGRATFEVYGNPQRVVTFDPSSPGLDCEYYVDPDSPDLEPTASLMVQEVANLRVHVDTGPDEVKTLERTIFEIRKPMRRVEPSRYLAELPAPGLDEAPESLAAVGCTLQWLVWVDPGIEGLPVERDPLRVRDRDIVDEFGDIVV